jgi:hypothetical protein
MRTNGYRRLNELVTSNTPKNITFIDCDPTYEPYIVVDVGDEWIDILSNDLSKFA